MKKCFFVWLLVLAAHHGIRAQAYLEGGYKVGFWANATGINNLLEAYNAKHPDHTFSKIKTGTGGRLFFAAPFYERTYFVVGLEWFRSTQVVQSANSIGQPDYKRLVVHNGGIVLGINIMTSDLVSFGLKTNAFNYFVVRAQDAPTNNFKFGSFPHETEIVNEVTPGIALSMSIAPWLGPFGFSLTPQIDIPLIHVRHELGSLAKEWNFPAPATGIKTTMGGCNISLTASLLIGKPRE